MSASRKNTSERSQTGRKLAGKNGAKSGALKTRADYWRDRIAKDVTVKGGKRYESETYAARMSWNGSRHFLLLTSNKETSASKAAEIYRFLQRNGWEATLIKYAAHRTAEGKAKRRRPTVGEFIQEAEKVATVNPRTFREYASSLRKIAAGALRLAPPKRGTVGARVDSRTGKISEKGNRQKLSHFDYRSPQRREFLEKIDRIPLERLTPASVARWKVDYVRERAGTPEKERSSKLSANTALRQARSLFSVKKILPFLPSEIALPSPLPFDGVELFGRRETGNMRYISKIDAGEILKKAQDELAETMPEQWKILLLALGAGLRRNEIDKLLWRQIEFEDGKIVIALTPYFKPKADSAGEVEVDPELLALLRGYRARATGEFVIESNRQLRREQLTGRSYSHTRAEEHFKALYSWLRENGVDARKPLHTLRKEFGSLICQKAGLFAASRALRHADVQITAQHYLDQKERVTVGLGALLEPENVVKKPKRKGA